MSNRTIVKAEPGYAVLTADIDSIDAKTPCRVTEDAVVAWLVADEGLIPKMITLTAKARVNAICADVGYLFPGPDGNSSDLNAPCYALRNPQGIASFPDGAQAVTDEGIAMEFRDERARREDHKRAREAMPSRRRLRTTTSAT